MGGFFHKPWFLDALYLPWETGPTLKFVSYPLKSDIGAVRKKSFTSKGIALLESVISTHRKE